jgi:hypothetical protein
MEMDIRVYYLYSGNVERHGRYVRDNRDEQIATLGVQYLEQSIIPTTAVSNGFYRIYHWVDEFAEIIPFCNAQRTSSTSLLISKRFNKALLLL